MHIEIDSSKCQGHALCALMSDDYFTLDDIGHIASTSGEVQHRRRRQSASGCRSLPRTRLHPVLTADDDTRTLRGQPMTSTESSPRREADEFDTDLDHHSAELQGSVPGCSRSCNLGAPSPNPAIGVDFGC